MRDGALWWNTAFEAAGFRNAVQVKDPTPDMDPMDIRYAWILWINRDERSLVAPLQAVRPGWQGLAVNQHRPRNRDVPARRARGRRFLRLHHLGLVRGD